MGYMNLENFRVLVDGNEERYSLGTEERKKVEHAFEFLSNYASDKVIYGINTGFGPMAQFKVDPNDLDRLQYNLIRSHANGSGKMLSPRQIKAVMILRSHSLALGYSGCSIGLLEQIEKYIEHDIMPIIYQHGGVGASGDLVQLAHLALGLIGEGKCYYQGNIVPVSSALESAGIEPVELKLRDGLATINGTSCMTAIGGINVIRSQNLLSTAVRISSYLNELVGSFDDPYSEELNAVKLHNGQQMIARSMRTFTKDSQLIEKRDEHDFAQHNGNNGTEVFSKKVQEYYSIRCVPQILGPVLDAIKNAGIVVEEEINSASDNPIVDVEGQKVFHGGNFHGDYISFEMDKLKLALIKMTMLLERQLNYLLNDRLNGKFPPFLNAGTLGLNYGMQGMQFTATSTTAESQALGTSMYTHSIPCNNDNQDIVSMGTNSALMVGTVIENCSEVMAITLLALAQATDCNDLYSDLSPSGKALYDKIRATAPKLQEDHSFSEHLENLKKIPMEGSLGSELFVGS